MNLNFLKKKQQPVNIYTNVCKEKRFNHSLAPGKKGTRKEIPQNLHGSAFVLETVQFIRVNEKNIENNYEFLIAKTRLRKSDDLQTI